MPDKLTDTRFVEVFNAGYAAIPAYGAMQVESAIEFADRVEKERIVHNVQLPQEDSLTPTRVLFNGPIAIEPGEYGVGTRDYPALAKYDGEHAYAMEAGTKYGTLAGEPHLSFTQNGFVSLGIVKSSFGRPTFRVVPDKLSVPEVYIQQRSFYYGPNWSSGLNAATFTISYEIIVDTDFLNKGVFVDVWAQIAFSAGSSGSPHSNDVTITLQEQGNAGNWIACNVFGNLGTASETAKYRYESSVFENPEYNAHISFQGYTDGSIRDAQGRLSTANLRVRCTISDDESARYIEGGWRLTGYRDIDRNRYNPFKNTFIND